MKNRLLVLLAVFTAVLFVSGSVMAAPFVFGTSSEDSLQTVLNDMTVDGNSSIDTTTDSLWDNQDSYWSVTASGSSNTRIIVEISALADYMTFGIYDPFNIGSKLQILEGSDGVGGKRGIDIVGDSFENEWGDTLGLSSNYFGFYLDSRHESYPNSGLWYSDSSKNNNEDHMVAYQGVGDEVDVAGSTIYTGIWDDNTYLLAFEDLALEPADEDYNDFVVLVESVTHRVPEPATLFLLGTGLVGFAGFARRRRLAKS